jgi:2-polyprenyl-3-methyl-5-hydroxy-6-metoxy-1,4-benzoquinol methylase
MFSYNELRQKEYFDSLALKRKSDGCINNSQKFIIDDVLAVIESQPQHKKIIEIGCGDGSSGFTEHFVRHGLDVTFLDISHEAVNNLKNHLENLGLQGFHPLAGTLKEVKDKLLGQTFDIVFFGDTLHHLTEDETVDLCKEISSVMHNESAIVGYEPNGLYPFWRLMPLYNKDFIWSVEHNITHCTRRGFIRKFTSARLALKKYTFHRIVPLFLINRWIVFGKVNSFLVKIPLLNYLSAYAILVAGKFPSDLTK